MKAGGTATWKKMKAFSVPRGRDNKGRKRLFRSKEKGTPKRKKEI